MNRTKSGVNISKYPLVKKAYELCREIDGLPASLTATDLVTAASSLTDEVWNYYEQDPEQNLRPRNMIYWFIGQPGCGKTTLAKRLKDRFSAHNYPAVHLDGDDLRMLTGVGHTKESFTKEHRMEQCRALQRLVFHIYWQGVPVIVSTVNPYRSVREEFKAAHPFQVREIFVYTETPRVRGENWSNEYEEPLIRDNTTFINTTNKTEEESFNELWKLLKKTW